ncbi:probable G-protein coupled receptor 139 [Heterodontus francisci]|uniref:probable G-protein coupled receptor 139 n=1 Tax=Heterodontus francisci TaxID=7792 RepID=UPI00355B0B15
MHAPGKSLVLAIYYPFLAAVGVPANLVTIVILSRGNCGLSRCITLYLVSMAVSDLLVIITAVILNRINGIFFPLSLLSTTQACTATSVLIYAARDSSVWLTVAFSFDRFVAICCQKLKTKYCTEKTAAVVIGTVCTLSCFKNIPSYLTYEPLFIINNAPWFCNIKVTFYISVGWTVYDWFDRISTPCLPFLLMLLLNLLTVRYILLTSRSRRRLRAYCNGVNQVDLEMESRRKSIVLLFTISGSFILLWTMYVVNFLFVRATNNNYFSGSNFSDPMFVLQETGNSLQLLSCCTNTCIYAVTQRKFRQELRNVAKFPLSLTAQLNK